MADQGEVAFVKAFAEGLSSQPVTYPDDFQPPLENYLKKVPTLPVPVPTPPERKPEESVAAEAIKITIKSVKPHQTYTLSVQSTDTIADIKAQLATVPGAPPADVQRLLLKGKALSDAKLLKEYDVKHEDTVNLMVKPGYHWDPTVFTPKETSSPAAITPDRASPPPITLVPDQGSKTRPGHGRIPSVVLSPSPSLTPLSDEKLVDIPLTLDTSNMPPPPPDTPYRRTVSQPEFWERLYAYLSNEFTNPSDAAIAWEDFFCASKGVLSVSEIAKIRDRVGLIGMNGT
ncbi:hypothetical protein NM688_g2374 [Phlebia brevispora]|uniref:Uncharacterized protein n=1 Tax=Phlebia brevispora TaxID=194682 RepID=A0ACC1T924_9APHY|nr:hypothetical protein NM688_g2374 [Phlebia brevispora]